jgi:hypothetical protein
MGSRILITKSGNTVSLTQESFLEIIDKLLKLGGNNISYDPQIIIIIIIIYKIMSAY